MKSKTKVPKIYNETKAFREENKRIIAPSSDMWRIKCTDRSGNVSTLGIWKSKPCQEDIVDVVAEYHNWSLSDSEAYSLRCLNSVLIMQYALELEGFQEGQVLNI